MNKNIVIIGGSSGIGLATVNLLATERGHKIYASSRTSDSNKELEGVEYFNLDVLKETVNIDSLPETVDALVYCPGSISLKPFNSITISEFKNAFELNVVGAIRVLQAMLGRLKKSNNASIVLFSTVAVSQGMSYHSSVAASKGAIEGLTRSLAAEYASVGMRFNAIAPSLVDTPLSSQFIKSSEKLDLISKRHPLKRIGTPEEIAALVRYLISDDSSWMSGQIIGLDGGLSAIKSLS